MFIAILILSIQTQTDSSQYGGSTSCYNEKRMHLWKK